MAKPQELNERQLEELRRERCGRCGCSLATHEPVSKNHCTGCFSCSGFKSGREVMTFGSASGSPKAA